MSLKKQNKQYDPTFDMMKGIGILLMILCHSINHNFRIIYSFHMPLFFILAGYFTKDMSFSWNSFGRFSKKNAIRLLVPYFVTMLVLSAWGLWQALEKDEMNFLFRPLLSTFWMGADELFSQYGIISINALWFLVALFWTRTIFYVILLGREKINGFKDWWVIVIGCIFTLLTYFLKTYTKIPPLPFSFLQGINGLLFYSIGWYVKRHELPNWLKVLSIICWPMAICWGQIEMFGCYYKIFPLDVLGACGATLVLYKCCSSLIKFVNKSTPVIQSPIRFLNWAGVNSNSYCNSGIRVLYSK